MRRQDRSSGLWRREAAVPGERAALLDCPAGRCGKRPRAASCGMRVAALVNRWQAATASTTKGPATVRGAAASGIRRRSAESSASPARRGGTRSYRALRHSIRADPRTPQDSTYQRTANDNVAGYDVPPCVVVGLVRASSYRRHGGSGARDGVFDRSPALEACALGRDAHRAHDLRYPCMMPFGASRCARGGCGCAGRADGRSYWPDRCGAVRAGDDRCTTPAASRHLANA